MKNLNLIRKIIVFPFVAIWRTTMFLCLPVLILIGFLCTNFEDEWEVRFFKKSIKNVFTFKKWL